MIHPTNNGKNVSLPFAVLVISQFLKRSISCRSHFNAIDDSHMPSPAADLTMRRYPKDCHRIRGHTKWIEEATGNKEELSK